jgi:hypothetical protein
MALKLKSTAKAAKFEYADGRMTVSWDVDASLADDELVEELRRIVAFYDAQAGKGPLPQRTPGLALARAQMGHPAPPEHQQPANGWAAMPPIPARLEGEVEFMPPEEQG